MLKTSFRLDKFTFSIGSRHDEPHELVYWLSKTPNERLAAMELMRQINYDYDPITDRVSRVLEVIEQASG